MSKTQMTVSIKTSLHKQLKICSVRQNKKMWEVVEQGIEMYLASCEQSASDQIRNK